MVPILNKYCSHFILRVDHGFPSLHRVMVTLVRVGKTLSSHPGLPIIILQFLGNMDGSAGEGGT